MTFKKKFLIIPVALISIAIVFNLTFGRGYSGMESVYSNNEKIASEYDTYGMDNSTSTVLSKEAKGDVKFSGSLTLWTFDSKEDTVLKVPYKFSSKGGKAKMVLISPDDTVTTLVERPNKSDKNEPDTLTIPIKKGTNRIKLVAYKKPNISFELNIDKGSFKEI